MAYVPYCRASLLIPFNDVPHLFVVMNDPCKDGLCLLVMLSSVKEGKAHDKSCVLNEADHEFIKHPTYVVYRLANTVNSNHITSMVAKKFYVEKADVTTEVFNQIVDGLYASDETRPFVISYAQSVGL